MPDTSVNSDAGDNREPGLSKTESGNVETANNEITEEKENTETSGEMLSDQGNVTRATDSSIDVIKFRYTLNTLYELRESPHSKKRPEYIDHPSLMSRGLWKSEATSSTSIAISGTGGGLYDLDRHGNDRTRNICVGGGSGPNGDGSSNRKLRTAGDPRKRLKEENDIVLSPQRRTFNMGIALPSFLNAQIPPPSISRSDRESNSRGRIGSGRILNRDVSWDYKPDKESSEPEISFRPGGGLMGLRDRDRSDRDVNQSTSGAPSSTASSNSNYAMYRGGGSEEKHERRSYSRDTDRDHRDEKSTMISHQRGGGRNNRYNNQYNNYDGGNYHRGGSGYDNRDEEPEWFSGGPTSQNDTIELRGFDDSRDDHNNEHPVASQPHNNHHIRNKLTTGGSSTAKKTITSIKKLSPAVTINSSKNVCGGSNEGDTNNNETVSMTNTKNNLNVEQRSSRSNSRSNSSSEDRKQQHQPTDQDFNFEDFLKLDTIGELLPNNDNAENKKRSSRFSQWFRQQSPIDHDLKQSADCGVLHQQQQKHDSPGIAIHDELNNIMNDFGDTNNVQVKRAISQFSYHQQLQLHHTNQQQPSQQQQQHDEMMKSTGGNNGDQNKYFSPISPAGKTITVNASNQLLEMLQRNDNVPAVGIGEKSLNQQIQSVEELEARMLQSGMVGAAHDGQNIRPRNVNVPTSMHKQQQIIVGAPPSVTISQQHQQDMVAFKKLLSQIADAQQDTKCIEQIGGLPAGQHMGNTVGVGSGGLNLLQLLNKQQRQEELKQIFPAGVPLQQQQHMMATTRAVTGGGSRPIHGASGGNSFQKMMHLGVTYPQQHSLVVKQQHDADLLKRPEAQALIDGLTWGELSPQNLFQQLSNSALSQRQRDTICAALNSFNGSPAHQQRGQSPNQQQQLHSSTNIFPPPQQQHQGQQTVPQPPPQVVGVSPAQPVPTQSGDILNLMFPPQPQQPIRLSPLPNGMPQRIPSPRELQFHTQSIMQNALIKKKLEEQRENFRKRQELQQQQQHSMTSGGSGSSATLTASNDNLSQSQQTQIQPSSNSGGSGIVSSFSSSSTTSPAKHAHVASPTPLAFTPTSVLRKMTAEKDDGSSNVSGSVNLVANDIGGNNMMNSSSTSVSKGTPNLPISGANSSGNGNLLSNIVKNQQRIQMSSTSVQQHQAQLGQPPLVQSPPNQNNTMHMQQSNQLLKWNQQQQQMMVAAQQQHQQQSNHSKPIGRPILKGSTAMQYASSIEYQQFQHQFNKRKQQQTGVGGGGGGGGSSGVLPQQSSQNIQNMMQQPNHSQPISPQPIGGNSQQLQQLLQHRHHQQHQQQQQQQQRALRSQFSYNQSGSANNDCIINYNRDGGLSPTSNQLARWFSPELLAKAQAGKLPSLNIGQALSLEEFERNIQHSSTTVHN